MSYFKKKGFLLLLGFMTVLAWFGILLGSFLSSKFMSSLKDRLFLDERNRLIWESKAGSSEENRLLVLRITVFEILGHLSMFLFISGILIFY